MVTDAQKVMETSTRLISKSLNGNGRGDLGT